MNVTDILKMAAELEQLTITREELLVRTLVRVRAMAADELTNPSDPEMMRETFQDIVRECSKVLKG